MTRTFRAAVPLVTVCALCIATVADASESAGLQDAAVQQIITMARAGLSERVILAKAEQIAAFPVLSGDDLARLKEIGVTDQVLVFMIEHAQPTPMASPAAPASPETAASASERAPTSGIRVVIDSDTRITYREIAIDDEVVHQSGKVWDGRSDPGVMLRRPPVLTGDPISTAYEVEVEPGIYDVSAGFAFSTVEGDPRDEWGEYEGEWYVTRGIRATGPPLPNEKDGANPGAVCEIAEGQICVVTARFEGQRPTPLGGLPDYSISYVVSIED
jgi:hypothetical protein